MTLAANRQCSNKKQLLNLELKSSKFKRLSLYLTICETQVSAYNSLQNKVAIIAKYELCDYPYYTIFYECSAGKYSCSGNRYLNKPC